MIDAEDLSAEVFTYEEGDGEKRIFHFNVTKMWKYLREWVLAENKTVFEHQLSFTAQPLPREWVEAHMRVGGYEFEPERVAALTAEQLRMPLLAFEWEKGATVIVDGAHRLKRLYDDNAPEIRIVIFPIAARERFQINLPGRGTLDLTGPRWTGEQIEAFKKRLGLA